MQILEQKMAGGLAVDMNINESYYEILSSKFNQCRDIAELTEKDILQEIESKIDINKEEESIEAFIKEKKKAGGSGAASYEIFSIYQLKSKVMNEKIEKIKR